MHFKRTKDASYPCVYDEWTTEDASWVIQDLRPEDDDLALEILVGHLCTDETLCSIQNLADDPASVKNVVEFWRECLFQRMSLGCYEIKNGLKNLVALNVCVVENADKDQDHEFEIKGEKWNNVYDVIKYIESKVDAYEYLGLRSVLHALGLVVKREYRGAKLGRRLLAAREPLCKPFGIKATATVFTGGASQKLAESCGFQTIADVTIAELAGAGLPYPKNDDRHIKYMVKRFS